MPANVKIIDQMRERQARVFRIACDPTRHGLSLKAISMDSGLGYDSLRNYASGETIMPLTALDCLIGVIPDELLSLLFSGDRVLVRAPEAINHDEIAPAMREYLAAKDDAHRPDSPEGRDIAPCEDNVLRLKFAKVRA